MTRKIDGVKTKKKEGKKREREVERNWTINYQGNCADCSTDTISHRAPSWACSSLQSSRPTTARSRNVHSLQGFKICTTQTISQQEQHCPWLSALFPILWEGWQSLAILQNVKSNPDNDIFMTLFQTPIHREPPHGTYTKVECYIHMCLTGIWNLRFKPSKRSNLSALINLQKREDIVLKPANKRSTVVVWDRKLYIAEVYKQFDNPINYQKLNNKKTLSVDQREIAKTVRDLISANTLPMTAKLLVKHHPKLPTFYLLSKIHKFNNPSWPIVSACRCPAEDNSEYLDAILQPLEQSLPTYVKDSSHALNLIEDINPNPNFEPKYLFIKDVTSLYTYIPHSDGLKALKHFLNKRESLDPPTDTLIRLVELVLNKNTFPFCDEVFSQMSGVAIGTNMDPSYTRPFMGHFEYTLLQQYKKPVPEIYKRCINDSIGTTSHWVTTNCWISSTLCRTSFLLSNVPTSSLKSWSLSWTWKSSSNKENSQHPSSINWLIPTPTSNSTHLTTSAMKTASRFPSF